VALQQVPPVAVTYGQAQQQQRNAALYEVNRLWRRVDTADITGGFLAIAPELLEVTNTAQARLGNAAVEYVPKVLEATGQASADKPRFTTRPDAMVGTAGSGVGTETVAYGAVTRTKSAIGAGMAPAAAKEQAGQWLTAALGTVFSDTGRMMEGLAGYSRPVSGWVRMLNGKSCGRCIVLAGKFYRKNRGFQRHPGCDCRHIIASENIAGDLTTSPTAYLDSLPTGDELREKYPGMTLDEISRKHGETTIEKALGSQANARAYKDGADPFQLINAYRQPGGPRGPGGIPSIKTAQVYGNNVKYTLEGTTRRGVADRQMREVRALSQYNPALGRRETKAVRLMPESIYKIARDQSHADQMLRDFGWVP